MNALDQERVDRARERLDSAARDGAVSDPAIRIVKLNPPVAGGEPVLLNRKLTTLSGLSGSGIRTLFVTIDGMQRDAGQPLDAFAATEIPDDPTEPKTAKLLSIISSCEQALLLSGAEMRGADMVLADLEAEIASAPSDGVIQPAATSYDGHVQTDERYAAFISDVLETPSEAASIEAGLAALESDPRRIALKAACSIDLSQISDSGGVGDGPRLFGSSNRPQSNLVRAEAEGELSGYDMTPGSPAYVLASRLDYVGIPTSPLDAVDVATEVLAQIEQAKEAAATYEASMQSLTGSAAELAAERDRVKQRRASAARRQATQHHLVRIARSQLTERGARPRGLMPVLIEEPFVDLPDELTNATLSMLFQHAEIAQVILVTNRSDVKTWCEMKDDRAEWVPASGWFAQEHDEW